MSLTSHDDPRTCSDWLQTVMSSIAELPIVSLLDHLKPKSLKLIKQIHALIITADLKTPPLLSKLIERYCALSPQSAAAACYAHRILNHQDGDGPFLLNTLIKSSQPRDSVILFSDWVSKSCLPFDEHTYIFALGACARSASKSALIEGKQIHARVLKEGFMSSLQVATTGIHFYASNGDVGCARKVFDEMPVRNAVSWNALLTGYCSQRDHFNMENAREALMLFKTMLADGENGVRPTDTTMVSVLSASSRLSVLETGICIHGFIEKTIHDPGNDVFIGTGLVDMYSKSGYLRSALVVFDRMTEKNVMTWTAMATGLALHGNGKQALKLLDEMKCNNVMPNVVTFTSLFSACCHSGLVEEGLQLFYTMEGKFGISPNIQHYCCIVDLLGRAGHLEKAYDFVVDLPIEPDPVLWRSLLSSCRLHGDTEMGEKVAKFLFHIQPSVNSDDSETSSEDYVALSNVYAMVGKWMDVGKVRKEMKKIKHVKLKPGLSVVKSSF